MRTVILVQARVGSTRLPAKVLAAIDGRPMIWHVMQRCRAAYRADEVVLCTGLSNGNEELAMLARRHGWAVFRGSEEALSLLADAAMARRADLVVRVTADCPLTDPAVIDGALAAFLARRSWEGLDLLYTTPGWPDGLDVEVMDADALILAKGEAREPGEREHVTTWLRRHAAAVAMAPPDHLVDAMATLKPEHRKWSVDTAVELDFVRRVVPLLPHAPEHYGWQATVGAIRKLEAGRAIAG